MFKKNNSNREELNKAIDDYNNGIYDDENIAISFIIGGFLDRIDKNIFKILGHRDDDIVGDIIFEITTNWINKNGVLSYYDWINSNIYYYIKNRCDRENYKGLTDREIRRFQNLHKKMKNEEDYNTDEYLKIKSKIVNVENTGYDNFSEAIDNNDYVYGGALSLLSDDETYLLDLYYSKKLTLEEIGTKIGVSYKTIYRRLKKIKLKLKELLF